MYADPTHIRDNAIKAQFNDQEYDLLVALAQFNGMQPAVFVRELALSSITKTDDKGIRGACAA